MKRISKILILAILCTVCLVLLACGKIDSIHFETEPRKTYVQGQEFTLEDAVIVATSKDKTTPVDMAEVSISGYNKDQLGSQTVTITYGEQPTPLRLFPVSLWKVLQETTLLVTTLIKQRAASELQMTMATPSLLT
mgnify:CR=1 FL=1